jgi:metal-sulfur cluster biosynthetic enzyme
MVTRRQIMGKLGRVIDPELGVSIVELGLIYGVEIGKAKGGGQQKIHIRMTFTTPACPMMNELLEGMKQKLGELGELDIEISITFEPLWTPDRMSRKAKMKLGMI